MTVHSTKLVLKSWEKGVRGRRGTDGKKKLTFQAFFFSIPKPTKFLLTVLFINVNPQQESNSVQSWKKNLLSFQHQIIHSIEGTGLAVSFFDNGKLFRQRKRGLFRHRTQGLNVHTHTRMKTSCKRVIWAQI